MGRGAALALAAAAVSSASTGYDYADVVPHYCNELMDWGPLPERPEKVSQLIQVQVFIRHGARVQCSAKPLCWESEAQETGSYACDISYLENTVLEEDGFSSPAGPFFRTAYMRGRNSVPGGSNCLVGQLVQSGFHMEVHNGKRLREAYVDREGFLPHTLVDTRPELVERDFFFRSTDVPRTRQSGMALVTGLYGEVHTGQLPHITLNTMDMSQENMLVTNACRDAVEQASESYFRDLPNKKDIDDLCKRLATSSVDKSSTRACFWFLQHLVDCLMSRMCPNVPFHPHNATIPPEFLAEDGALFRRVWAEVDVAQHGYFQALKRLGTGPFVGEVLQAAQGALNGSAPKFLLFSGHDTGPMEPLWAAFDLRDRRPYWPPFASMLVLEVWNSSSGPIVRWISNGEVVAGGPQPFGEFQRQAEALVPSETECKGDAKPRQAMQQRTQALRLGPQGEDIWAPRAEIAFAAGAGAIASLAAMCAWQRGAPLLSIRAVPGAAKGPLE